MVRTIPPTTECQPEIRTDSTVRNFRVKRRLHSGIHFLPSFNDGKTLEELLRLALVAVIVTVPLVAPVAQRYHITSDTLGREFDPGKRNFFY